MRLQGIYVGLVSLLLAGTAWGQSDREYSGLAGVVSYGGRVMISDLQGDGRLARHHSTFHLQNSTITTDANSFLTLALSNGATLHLRPNTSIEVRTYKHGPFDASEDDWQYEPSRSALEMSLLEGQMLVVSETLRPSSVFSVRTELGTVVFGQGRYSLSTALGAFQLSTVEGSAAFTPVNRAVPREIAPGRTAEIIGTYVGRDSLDIEPLDPESFDAHMLAQTAEARRRVYFSTPAASASQEWAIRPRWVTPLPEEGQIRVPINAHYTPRPEPFRPDPDETED